MIFRRTLHPVGHGAFFTEHLKTVDSKAREKAFFNVVYDCGATARGQNTTRIRGTGTSIHVFMCLKNVCK